MTKTGTIRVAVVDDHGLFREGLKDLLSNQPDLEVVAEGADGSAALSIAAEGNVDVIVIDLCMPNLGGIAAIRRLKNHYPSLKFVVVSMYDDETHQREAMQAGADAYHSKMDGAAEVIKSIRRLMSQKNGNKPSLCVRQANGVEDAVDLEVHTLTATEQKVLEELSSGLPNKDLADRLMVSEQTLKNHLNSIFRKMGVKNRLEAVRKGLEKKWISIYQ